MAGLPQSNIDWARYMEGLQGKTNVDADNFSKVGKANIVEMNLPSTSRIELPVPANNKDAIMPANGYLQFYIYQASDYYGMSNQTTKLKVVTNIQRDVSYGLFMPVNKGDVVKVFYSPASAINLSLITIKGEL